MKFAHFSDIHIGGWREEKLKNMSVQAFNTAADICIQQAIDFVLIAGDLFDSALPQIDLIRDTTAVLKKLHTANIPVYLIPGSHDFSPSGKTMIEVLEKAGLCINVFKHHQGQLTFTHDKKTGVKLTGILGLACGLDKKLYEQLQKKPLEDEEGFKIFLFHTIIDEVKPEHLKLVLGEPLNSLPKNFHYYAGGHPHYVYAKHMPDYGLVAYPGALFPNNFAELEMFKGGGFYIVDEHLNYKHQFIQIKPVISIHANVEEQTSTQATSTIKQLLNQQPLNEAIVTLRIEGTLSTGTPTEIPIKELIEEHPEAYCILLNKTKLTNKTYDDIQVDLRNVEDIEKSIMTEAIQQAALPAMQTETLAQQLLELLTLEKDEGEKTQDFELRLIKDLIKKTPLEEVWE
ncbi:MAG: DNA repair exonuclease [Nanoarchaeota archaeon]|nr:DNA repair exonuclease [Nanoarchaeota archaeon]